MNQISRPPFDVESVLGFEPKKQRKQLLHPKLVLAASLIALASGVGLWLAQSAGQGADTYVTHPVEVGTLRSLVTATGTVEPRNIVDVSVEQSGLVKRVNVTWGERVTAGQVLAELDTDKLEFAVLRSKAALEAARARLVDSETTELEKKKELERRIPLAERGFSALKDLDASKAGYDRARSAVASARADIAAAEADLKGSQNSLVKARIVSPIDGVVLKRSVEPGQTVAASLSAPVLFTLAEDLTKMQLKVDVDEADIVQVNPGQIATFRIEAMRDRPFNGVIETIRPQSETVQGVVTYKVVLNVENLDLLLRPGMTATADILTREVTGALLVPNAALRFSPPPATDAGKKIGGLITPPPEMGQSKRADDTPLNARSGGKARVWVLAGNRIERRNIVVGISDGRSTQIRDGNLKPGERVVVDIKTKK